MKTPKPLIAYRLEGWGLESPFLAQAIAKIHELSYGVPRDILYLCQHSYDAASDEGRTAVDAADVERAFSKMQIIDSQPAVEAVV